MSHDDQYREEIMEWRRVYGIATDALLEIRKEGGRVCAEFETCTHPSCASSHKAWEIADKALHDCGVLIDYTKESPGADE